MVIHKVCVRNKVTNVGPKHLKTTYVPKVLKNDYERRRIGGAVTMSEDNLN